MRRRWRRPWRHELAGDRCGREGDIARLAQVDDSGDGDGHKTVGTVDGAVALGERLDHDIPNTQVIEADGDRADVDDGVDGAHLVEHDGVRRFAVSLGLSGGERGKDGERTTLGAIAQLRVVDNLGDVGQGTVVMVVVTVVVVGVLMRVLVAVDMLVLVMMLMLTMVVMVVMSMLMRVLGVCFVAIEPCHIVVVVLELLCQLNIEVAGVNAVLVHARDGNRKAVDRQCGELLAQVLLVCAQVEQGGDGHIAADARGAVDDKRVLMVGHGMLLSGRRVYRRSDD